MYVKQNTKYSKRLTFFLGGVLTATCAFSICNHPVYFLHKGLPQLSSSWHSFICNFHTNVDLFYIIQCIIQCTLLFNKVKVTIILLSLVEPPGLLSLFNTTALEPPPSLKTSRKCLRKCQLGPAALTRCQGSHRLFCQPAQHK